MFHGPYSPNGTFFFFRMNIFFEMFFWIFLLQLQVHKNIYFVLSLLKRALKLSKEIPMEPTELLHSLTEWLALAAASGEKIVLILEGVNNVNIESM